jgi:cold shock protein
MQGICKFFNHSKGFGFLIGEDGKEYFCHVSGTLDKIVDQDQVTFELTEGKRGVIAVQVKRVKDE